MAFEVAFAGFPAEVGGVLAAVVSPGWWHSGDRIVVVVVVRLLPLSRQN